MGSGQGEGPDPAGWLRPRARGGQFSTGAGGPVFRRRLQTWQQRHDDYSASELVDDFLRVMKDAGNPQAEKFSWVTAHRETYWNSVSKIRTRSYRSPGWCLNADPLSVIVAQSTIIKPVAHGDHHHLGSTHRILYLAVDGNAVELQPEREITDSFKSKFVIYRSRVYSAPERESALLDHYPYPELCERFARELRDAGVGWPVSLPPLIAP